MFAHKQLLSALTSFWAVGLTSGGAHACPRWDVSAQTHAFKGHLDEARPKRITGGHVGEWWVRPQDPDATVDWQSPQALGQLIDTTLTDFYGANPDADPQFLVIYSAFPMDDLAPFYAPFANDVRGIGYARSALGEAVFDLTPESGLEGVLFMGPLAPHLADPEYAAHSFLHEWAHRWGAFLWREGPAGDEDLLLGRACAHWSYLADLPGAAMGGNSWTQVAEGRYQAQPMQTGFHPIEQYLMGLRGPAEVPDMTVLRRADVGPCAEPTHMGAQNPSWADTVSAPQFVEGQPERVRIEELIAVHGPRLPRAGAAPTTFTARFVLLTDLDGADPALFPTLESLRAQLTDRWTAAASAGLAVSPVMETRGFVRPNTSALGAPCDASLGCEAPGLCVQLSPGPGICSHPCAPACPTGFHCESGWCAPSSVEADAGLMDAGLMDAGLMDAGLMDAGLMDGGADQGLSDATPDASPQATADGPSGCALSQRNQAHGWPWLLLLWAFSRWCRPKPVPGCGSRPACRRSPALQPNAAARSRPPQPAPCRQTEGCPASFAPEPGASQP